MATVTVLVVVTLGFVVAIFGEVAGENGAVWCWSRASSQEVLPTYLSLDLVRRIFYCLFDLRCNKLRVLMACRLGRSQLGVKPNFADALLVSISKAQKSLKK